MSTVWPFVPQRGMKERMQWRTEVIRCKSAEQRICLRSAPRTILEFDYHLLPKEIEAATTQARDLGADEVLMPFWNELEYVGAVSASATSISIDTTTKRFKNGSLGFIIDGDGDYETFTITGVNASSLDVGAGITGSYTGAVVMPCYPARFLKPFDFRKFSAPYMTASVECILAEDFGITGNNPYPSFNSSYVLSDRPLISGSAREAHTREFQGFENIGGPLFYSDLYAYPISMGAVSWSFDTIAEAWQFRRWMYEVKGKQQSFYMPRWTRDFVMAEDRGSGADYIVVEENEQLQDTYLGAICVVMKSGTQYYYIVDGWQSAGAGTYQMDLTTTLGVAIAAADVHLICRMPKVRFNSDVIEFTYRDAYVVNARLPIMEVPE